MTRMSQGSTPNGIVRPATNGITQFSGGIIVPLMGRTDYDFSYLAAGATETVDLAVALGVGFVTSAVLVCRVHANNINDAGCSFDLNCYPTAPSDQDPQEFTYSSTDLSLTVASTDGAGKYLKDTLSTPPIGAWWKVQLQANQHPSLQKTVAAQLSAFLVLRNG